MSYSLSDLASKIIEAKNTKTQWEANKAALSSLPAIIWNTDITSMDYGQYGIAKPNYPVSSFLPDNPTVRTVFLSNLDYGGDTDSVAWQRHSVAQMNKMIDLIKAGTPITPPIFIKKQEVIDGVVRLAEEGSNYILYTGNETIALCRSLGVTSIKILEFSDIEYYSFSWDAWNFSYLPDNTGTGASNTHPERLSFSKKADPSIVYNFDWSGGATITSDEFMNFVITHFTDKIMIRINRTRDTWVIRN
ncbi:MAG: hypothetical protein H6Q14_767 [Bacteroidetes bacterium]|nr:hypothetical protein [Bacteroidota bacterium]